MSWRRALLAWCLLAAVMLVHGVLRERLATPFLGELPAHQLSVATASLLLLVLTWLMLPWIGAREARDQLRLGAAWTATTVAFELVFGRFVVGAPWSRLVHDYDLSAGRLWLVVLLVVLLAPWLAGRLHARHPGGRA